MIGRIFAFDPISAVGMVDGPDGNLLIFKSQDWLGEDAPRPQLTVEYQGHRPHAIKVRPLAE